MPSPASERAFLDHPSTSHLSGKRRTLPLLGATIDDYTTPMTTATSPELTADGAVLFEPGAGRLVVPVTGLVAVGSHSFSLINFGCVAEIVSNPVSVGIDINRLLTFYTRENVPNLPIFDSTFGTEFVGTGPIVVEGNANRDVVPYFPDPNIEHFTQPRFVTLSVGGAGAWSVVIHSLFIELT